MRISKNAAFGVIGLVGALGAGGTAYAASSSGSSSAAANHQAAKPAAPSRSLLNRADHGSLEVRVKGRWATYSMDRGRVTGVTPTSITLARADGQQVTAIIDPGTRFHGVTSETQVQANRTAVVVSDNGTAVGITQKKPQVKTG